MNKPHVSFLYDESGTRVWYIRVDGLVLELSTDQIKAIAKQLKTLEELDWKSPF